jgi:carboxylesterase type B
LAYKSAVIASDETAIAETTTGKGTAAYLYWFTWKTPVLNGRPRSIHCIDLPFCFDKTDRSENLTVGGPGPRALAAKSQ